MKTLSSSLIALSLLCALMAGTATANDQKVNGKNRKKSVTLAEDILIKDRLIQKGTYQVRFDAQKNELALLREGEIVAIAPVTVEMKAQKAARNSMSFTTTDRGKLLTGLTFEGDRRTILISEIASTESEEE